MSYTSENELPNGTSLKRLKEIISLLGYKSVQDKFKIQGQVGCYFWYDTSDYKSWTGVELNIYSDEGMLTVHTRTRISRSYWDLTHQNKTIKLVRDLFGGSFATDEGKNRYLRPTQSPPSPLSSGCYLARWKFHNGINKSRLYLQSRKLEGDVAREEPTHLFWLDETNPRLLSNNMLITFLIAIWEEYHRATFTAVLHYADRRESVLKNVRLSHAQLEQIATERQVERAIADGFSFQRPTKIGENFKKIDSKLDLLASMRKPVNRRKASLIETIEELVDIRNKFVHEGDMEMSIFDSEIENILSDIVDAVDTTYRAIGKHFNFTPILDY